MTQPLSDPEIVAMTQQYTQTPQGEYVTHLAYEEINRQVAAGRPWAKCPNCGDPYPLDRPGASSGICSKKCHDEYADYLNNPLEW
jgi:hypothetical protein